MFRMIRLFVQSTIKLKFEKNETVVLKCNRSCFQLFILIDLIGIKSMLIR